MDTTAWRIVHNRHAAGFCGMGRESGCVTMSLSTLGGWGDRMIDPN